MSAYRLRNDLERIRLGAYALPLGIEPVDVCSPVQGYTITYNQGSDDEPDTYTFHIVVSHERLRPILHRAFDLLPEWVSPILEVDSYDAYRTVDVFIGREDSPITKADFLSTWTEFEPFLLEEGAVGAGANSDEPFIEIFLDQWKGVSIHVPLDMRNEVADMLHHEFELDEVQETWPAEQETGQYDATIRPVLDLTDEEAPGLEDVLLELRRRWIMELNVDPDRNLDETGRDLGLTLWHATILVYGGDHDPDRTAFMNVWASASSLSELENLIDEVLDRHPQWDFFECFSVTRVAFDDRPERLESLKPRRHVAEVHLVEFEAEERAGEKPATDVDGGADV